jgi:hypothetical protein
MSRWAAFLVVLLGLLLTLGSVLAATSTVVLSVDGMT